jgi:hypothetical protein
MLRHVGHAIVTQYALGEVQSKRSEFKWKVSATSCVGAEICSKKAGTRPAEIHTAPTGNRRKCFHGYCSNVPGSGKLGSSTSIFESKEDAPD